jgi:hypothetical protein
MWFSSSTYLAAASGWGISSNLPVTFANDSAHLADLREKTLRGMKGRKGEGYFVGERTFGYESTPSEKVRLDNRGKEKPAGSLMQIHQAEAEVVRGVFQEFADGRSSSASLSA